MTSVENVRRVLGVVLMSILMVAVAFAQAKTSSDKAPSYELKDLSVDYGVKQGNQNGLLVKVVISATNANGVESFLRVTLLDEDEEPLEDTDGRFEVDGFVGTQSKIKPTRSPMDVTVNFFIPYDDIEVIGSGEQLLMLDVDVVDGVGDYYQHLGFHGPSHQIEDVALILCIYPAFLQFADDPVGLAFVDFTVPLSGVVQGL